MEILVLIRFVIDGYSVDNIVKALNMVHFAFPMLGKVKSLSLHRLNGTLFEQTHVDIEYVMFSKEMRTKDMLMHIKSVCEENKVINFTCRCEADDKLHTIFRGQYTVSYTKTN